MPVLTKPFQPQKWSFDHVRSASKALLEGLTTSEKGLTETEARERLVLYGPNEPARKKKRTILIQLLEKMINPLVVVLLVIAGFSLFFGEKISAILVGAMALASVLLSFIQEFRANREAQKLSEMVRATATIYRGGKKKEVRIRDLVPGDIIELAAGDIVPADVRILSSKDLFVNQGSLTGESIPYEKVANPPEKNGTELEASNIAFMGSSVVSGSGLVVAVHTGLETKFGEISSRLARR